MFDIYSLSLKGVAAERKLKQNGMDLTSMFILGFSVTSQKQ